jgi:hypothetical protein
MARRRRAMDLIMKKIYKLHFGKAYPMWMGHDSNYHRILVYSSRKAVYKALARVNKFKQVEWTDVT